MPGSWNCDHCGRSFTRKSSLTRHIHRVHGGKPTIYDCQICGLVFQSVTHMKLHYENHQFDQEYRLNQSIFLGILKSFSKTHPPGTDDADAALFNDQEKISEVIRNELNLGVPLKVSLVLIVNFYQYDEHGHVVDQTYIPFRSRHFEVTQYSLFSENLRDSMNQIIRRMEDFQEHGSGWVLDRILRTNVEFGKIRSLNGAAGFSIVKCPRQAEKIKLDGSTDCFYKSVAHVITGKRNTTYLERYLTKNVNRLDDSPHVHVSDIPRFLRINPQLSLRVNVLYLAPSLKEKRGKAEDQIYPIYCSKNPDARYTVNLLLHKVRGENGEIQHHFSLIDDLNKFLRLIYRSESGGQLSYQKSHCCANCLGKFSTRKSLREHEESCLEGKTQQVTLSDESISFSKPHTQFEVPFIGFFDFEAISEKNEEMPCVLCENRADCIHIKTCVETNQTPIAYSYIIVDKLRNVIVQRSYTGPDPVNHLINSMLTAYEKEIKPLYQLNEELIMTREEEERYLQSSNCHICHESFMNVDNKIDKVRDHDHYTGEFLGAAHQTCNLMRQDKKMIPMYAHNFSGYDSSLLIKHLDPSKLPDDVKLNILPLNTEKIRTVRINKFEMLDSYGFLQGSLDELARNLTKATSDFKILEQMNLYQSEEEKNLLLRKGEHFFSLFIFFLLSSDN